MSQPTTPTTDPDKGRVFNRQNGTMTTPGGKVVRPKKLKQTPASNGITEHVTTLWEDGYVSCTCQGWIMKKGSQPRTCKHTKASVASNFSDMLRPAAMLSAKLKDNIVLPPKPSENDDRMVEL